MSCQMVTSLLSAPIASEVLRWSSSHLYWEGGQRHPGYHLPDIIKCDVEFRKDLYSNSVLSDGTTMVPVSVSMLLYILLRCGLYSLRFAKWL
jgi:hypothetical protein